MTKKIEIQEGVSVSDTVKAAPVAAPAPVTAASLKQAVALVGKAQPGMRKASSVLSAVPITDVSVIIGMLNREGKREEIIHDINTADATRIVLCHQNIEEKTRAVKEEGQLVGYEPTGEYILTVKVKYIKE